MFDSSPVSHFLLVFLTGCHILSAAAVIKTSRSGDNVWPTKPYLCLIGTGLLLGIIHVMTVGLFGGALLIVEAAGLMMLPGLEHRVRQHERNTGAEEE